MIKKILQRLGLRNDADALSDKFTTIYRKNLFQGKESVSGPGSDLFQTRIIQTEIPKLLRKYEIRSFIDAPCGDFFWMRHVDLSGIQYIGCDIVADLIQRNTEQFAGAERRFQCVDIVNEVLPPADVIFCRDCLVHLTQEQIVKALQNFLRSDAKYLLTTTFPAKTENMDLGSIIWRPLNLQLPPYSFPTPVALINEGCTENDGIHADKSLGLWKLDDLRGLALLQNV